MLLPPPAARLFQSLLLTALLPVSAWSSKLEYTTERTAFYRDENPSVEITVEASAPADSLLEVLLDGRSVYKAAAKQGANEIALPTHAFRSRTHKLTARLLDTKGTEVAVRSFPIELTKRPAQDALLNWLWMNGGPENSDFYKAHGFDFFGGPMLPYSEGADRSLAFRQVGKLLNTSLGRGELISVVPNGGLWKREFTLFPPKGEDIWYLNASRHGDQYYNPFNHAVAEKQDAANRQFMETVKNYPNATIAWTDMEIQDDLTLANLNAEGRARMEELLGFTPDEVDAPEYVANHVISDNDRKYRLFKYTFQGGNGVHAGLQRMANMVKKYRPDMMVMTDPYRHASLYNVYPGADIIHSWTYSNPDPKSMLYIEQLRTACAPLKQTPLQIVTLLNYPGMLDVPKLRENPPGAEGSPHEEWMGMGPDRLKETTWINLSRAPKIVGYFYGSEIDPVRYADDTHRIPPETSDAIGELAERIFRPYGKMIRNLEVSPRKIAVLNSQAAALYNRSPDSGYGSYAGYRTLPFQGILEMAHYNADIVFDESIEQGALDRYEVLFLPRCDTLTETVVERIKAFQKRGGLVYSDQYLGPELDVIHRFDFDFSYLPKVNARANLMGETYSEWNDQAERLGSKVDLKKVLGVPAHKDQEIKEGYAKILKEVVSAKVPHTVESDTPTVLFNLTEKNGTRYLFVINDKRTYDERTGRYKGILEKNVPQTVTVRLRNSGGATAVAYDMLKRSAIPTTQKGDVISFPVELDSLGGTIIALYPSQLEAISLSAPSEVILGHEQAVTVTFRDSTGKPVNGLQPVRVELFDADGKLHEDSDWICLENGKGTFSFTPAWSDPAGQWKIKATDLTAGISIEDVISIH